MTKSKSQERKVDEGLVEMIKDYCDSCWERGTVARIDKLALAIQKYYEKQGYRKVKKVVSKPLLIKIGIETSNY